MNVSARIGAFVLGLAVVFAAAVGIGNAVGPVATAPEQTHGGDAHADVPADPTDPSDPAMPAIPADPVTGLSVWQDGYLLELATPTLPAGQRSELAFRVVGPDGEAVTSYEPTHDKELHLVVVRRDATGYQHVHPERDATGRWSVPLTLEAAGSYKVFADFAPEGRDDSLVLSADLQVAGDYAPVPLPAVSRTATVDGYTVTLEGDLRPGEESELVLSISRDGEPVTDLEEYLAAYGHLVALRPADLAYLHVHPQESPEPGPEVRFAVEVPTAGDYRLFLDFQHGGVVRTAALTATAEQEHR